MDPVAIELAIEIDRHSEPIAGRLRRTDGTIVPFVGWLELAQALEAATRARPGSRARGCSVSGEAAGRVASTRAEA